MCLQLKKLQKSKYMVETGSYNLIQVFKQIDVSKVRLETSITLRKATSCRETQLLDSFVSNKLIEAIMMVLNKFGYE